jgi:hypothetical protein
MLVYVTNCWVGGGWVGGEGKLSFQCLRPSASLRAAGKKKKKLNAQTVHIGLAKLLYRLSLSKSR